MSARIGSLREEPPVVTTIIHNKRPLPLTADDVRRILGYIEPQSPGCWLWTNRLDTRGYGRVNLLGRRERPSAHRAVWQILSDKPVPDGLDLDHLCRVRNCVNPDHLEPVTRQVNSWRAHHRHWCGGGHRRTPENVDAKGMCRACRTERLAQRYVPGDGRDQILATERERYHKKAAARKAVVSAYQKVNREKINARNRARSAARRASHLRPELEGM